MNTEVEKTGTRSVSKPAHAPVDVLIVGGGLQGLVLLETLTKRGYSTAVITNGPLGHGQSLHGHGFLESGYTSPDRNLRTSVVEDWLPYLEAVDVDTYGEWFFIAPADPVRSLQPRWDDDGYPHEPAAVGDLPVEYHESDLFGRETDTRVVAIEDYCFDRRGLVRRMAAGHDERIVTGDITEFGVEHAADGSRIRWVDVDSRATGERIRLAPSHVLVAAGVGTPGVVDELAAAVGAAGGDGAEVRAPLEQITFDRIHMLTLRGSPEALPDVSAIIAPKKLKVVSHRGIGPDGRRGETDLVTWYVTNKPLAPMEADAASDGALAEVDSEHAVAGFNALFSAIPGVRKRAMDGDIEFYVYAGCKQGIAGELNRPYCEPIEPITNATLALPSVAGGAWVTAERAVGLAEKTVEPSGTAGPIPGAGDVTVGDVTEHGSNVAWLGWEELLAAYPGIS